jgi:hypothetical protein
MKRPGMAGEAMVAARRIIALPVETEQRQALVEISRSRTEPANRVERARIILAYTRPIGEFDETKPLVGAKPFDNATDGWPGRASNPGWLNRGRECARFLVLGISVELATPQITEILMSQLGFLEGEIPDGSEECGETLATHRCEWSLVGHTRLPFTGYRPDHRAWVELAAIDAHRAAEVASDLERRHDDGVAREARRDRFEICDFAGRAAAGHSVPPRSVRWVRKVLNSMRTKRQNGPAGTCIAWRPRGAPAPLRLDIQREKRKRHVGGHHAFGVESTAWLG